MQCSLNHYKDFSAALEMTMFEQTLNLAVTSTVVERSVKLVGKLPYEMTVSHQVFDKTTSCLS